MRHPEAGPAAPTPRDTTPPIPAELALMAAAVVVLAWAAVIWQERYERKNGAKWRRIVAIAALIALTGVGRSSGAR